MDYKIELFLCVMVPKATVFDGLSYSILMFPSSTDGIMRVEPVWKLDRFIIINSCLDKLRSEILSCTEVYMQQIVCGQYKMGCSHVQSSVKSQEGMHTDPALRWHGSHSAEVNENINLGYSHDQRYS